MTPADLDPDEFLTVADVASTLKLNQQTVRNWIDAGSLPAVRVGRRVRIKRSDLDRILENGYRGTQPAASTIEGPSATDFWSGEPVGAVEPGSRETQGPGNQGPQTASEAGGSDPGPRGTDREAP